MFDINKFRGIVESFYKQLLNTNTEITSIKLSEEKFSLREIIGHLIDSASNNHQRFVRLQFEDLLDFPGYDCEEWVRIQKYNSLDWNVLVTLWYQYNVLLLHVIENIDETKLKNVWVKNEETPCLEFLVNDYYRHLKVHMEHFSNRRDELPE